jgi:hypothetical protein
MGFGQAPGATMQNLVCRGQASMVATREVLTAAWAFSGGAYEPPDRDHTVSAISGRARSGRQLVFETRLQAHGGR